VVVANGLARIRESVPKRAMECNVHLHQSTMTMKTTLVEAVDQDDAVVAAVAAVGRLRRYSNYSANLIDW
jgi:hypothetical protein